MAKKSKKMQEWRPLVEHECHRCKNKRKYAPAEVEAIGYGSGLSGLLGYFVRCKCKALTTAKDEICPISMDGEDMMGVEDEAEAVPGA